MKIQFITAALALFTTLPASPQVSGAQPVKPAASGTASQAEKNQKIGDIASSCEALLATSAVNLPKIFTPDKVDGDMIKFSAIGSKAIGDSEYRTLVTDKISKTSLPLGFLKVGDPVLYNDIVKKNADAAIRCRGFLIAGWPNVELK